MAQVTAAEKWVQDGGLERPHTREGVKAAKRLMNAKSPDREAIRRYLATAPDEFLSKRHQRGPDPSQGSSSVRTVSGGLPGQGKRS